MCVCGRVRLSVRYLMVGWGVWRGVGVLGGGEGVCRRGVTAVIPKTLASAWLGGNGVADPADGCGWCLFVARGKVRGSRIPGGFQSGWLEGFLRMPFRLVRALVLGLGEIGGVSGVEVMGISCWPAGVPYCWRPVGFCRGVVRQGGEASGRHPLGGPEPALCWGRQPTGLCPVDGRRGGAVPVVPWL